MAIHVGDLKIGLVNSRFEGHADKKADASPAKGWIKAMRKCEIRTRRVGPTLCGESMREWKRGRGRAAASAWSRSRRHVEIGHSPNGAARSHNTIQRLLIDKPIGRPHALIIAVRRIDEFHVMADYAKSRIHRRGDALKSLEKLLHFLMLASLCVLIRRIEFVLRHTAERIRPVSECLLRLRRIVLSLCRACRREKSQHRKENTGALLHVNSLQTKRSRN